MATNPRFPGYQPDARDIKSITVARVARPILSQAREQWDQAQMTRDPERKKELLYLAAIEKRFAEKAAQAQQGVQDAALSTNPLQRGDVVYGSAWQEMAKMRRGMLRDQAAQEYNASLPAGYRGQFKSIGNPFYG